MDEEEISLFRATVGDAKPLPQNASVLHPRRKPRPVPRNALRDLHEALPDSLSDHVYWADNLDEDDAFAFHRPGLQNQVLRKLRRGQWGIQGELDLHGLTVAEARLALLQFLHACQQSGARCVRIIHGKGLSSKNHVPVLKNKVANWLMQREETLAFCHAKVADGGAGALLVLLKVS